MPWRAEASGGPTGEVGVVEAAISPVAKTKVWVSYQIEIAAVDGRTTDYRAAAPCVYYQVELPIGEHDLALRLRYQTPVHEVRSDRVVPMTVRLEAGQEYRLLDLSAGTQGLRRKFTPWLQPGAPKAGKVGTGSKG